ncbi:MAG: hypothetical protein N2439_15590, partial [Anaerolineae bacterium]|nr:hypothetical protein [Anaerolineae bacterium]
MWRTFLWPLIGLYMAVALASCTVGERPAATPTTVRISGSTSMMPALQELTATYRLRRPNVRFELLGNGSAAGLAELQA